MTSATGRSLATWFSEAAERVRTFETKMAEQVGQLEQREKELRALETTLRDRGTALQQRERRVAEQIDAQAAEKRRLAEVAETLKQREQQLQSQREQLSKVQQQLDQRATRLTEQVQELERRESEYLERNMTLVESEEAIDRFRSMFDRLLTAEKSAGATPGGADAVDVDQIAIDAIGDARPGPAASVEDDLDAETATLSRGVADLKRVLESIADGPRTATVDRIPTRAKRDLTPATTDVPPAKRRVLSNVPTTSEAERTPRTSGKS